jgi:hypothetical protein
MKTKIYERIYDNPINKDGTKKPNKLLGTFQIKGGLPNDYGYTCYGYKNHKLYKIVGKEVSYQDGGTKHFVHPIEDCEEVKVYLNLTEKECEL